MVNIAMNRAVHLARRDAHYRRCIDILEKRFEEASIARRRERIDLILSHLGEARDEAIYALRGHGGWRTERLFVKFLNLVYDAAKASQVMVQHEALLKEDKSFLKRFLGAGIAKLVQFEERSRSMEAEILDKIAELVLYASPTYSELKRMNTDSLSNSDKARYHIAYDAVIPQAR
jgi:hypothetical protein